MYTITAADYINMEYKLCVLEDSLALRFMRNKMIALFIYNYGEGIRNLIKYVI